MLLMWNSQVLDPTFLGFQSGAEFELTVRPTWADKFRFGLFIDLHSNFFLLKVQSPDSLVLSTTLISLLSPFYSKKNIQKTIILFLRLLNRKIYNNTTKGRI